MLLRILRLFFVLVAPAAAAERPVPVDLELAFLVDTSGSIDADETELQRRGYAAALKHPRILNAITSGYLGRIAVAFIEFGADGCTRLSVEWTGINRKEAAETFGDKIIALPYSLCPGGNAVADAILYFAKLIEQNRFQGTRRVIDISGDGPNTLGRSLSEVRQEVLAAEITINALVLERPEMPDLPEFFRHFVIGGQGAFQIEARDHNSFAAAILKKMFSEIAAEPLPTAQHAQRRR